MVWKVKRVQVIFTFVLTLFPSSFFSSQYFFPLPFSHRTSPLPPAITMSLSPLSFLLIPSTSQPAPPQALAVICSPTMSLSLFCLVDQFIHSVPRMSEIIWYLSFSDWLISLSIMLPRPIHTIAKDKYFFFLQPSRIPLYKCPTVVLSTHLWIDTWAASISWGL